MTENERLDLNSIEVGITVNGKQIFVRDKLPVDFFNEIDKCAAMLLCVEALTVELCGLVATREE
jgi:hypothetical protein